MFDYFVASAKLLQLFLVIFLCSVFIPIEDFFLGTAAAAAAVNEITTGSMAAVGSDAICGTAVAAFVDVAAVAIAVVAASVAAVGPDAICGTAAAWFHVVDYAC
jgi:hypothetical protein